MIAVVQNDPRVPAGVFAALLDEWRIPWRLLRPDLGVTLPVAAGATIILGGEMGVHDEDRHPFLRPLKGFIADRLAAGTPLLGVCLGGQLLAEVAGGRVDSRQRGEKGLVEITLTEAGRNDPLFAGVPGRFAAFQWHNDSFTVPAPGRHLAASTVCPGQAFRVGAAWGVQFHPEVDRAIVADWSGAQAAALPEFVAAETVHHALARRLLANFLAIAGLCPLSGAVPPSPLK